MKRVCLLILALLTPSLVAAQSPLEITGYFSQANDINNAGQVVGYVTTASGAPQAFVWTAADGMQDVGSVPSCDQQHTGCKTWIPKVST
jgi:probable HAF family extracellular repeat protein